MGTVTIDVIAVSWGTGGNPRQKYGIFIWRELTEARATGNMLHTNGNVSTVTLTVLFNPAVISQTGLKVANDLMNQGASRYPWD